MEIDLNKIREKIEIEKAKEERFVEEMKLLNKERELPFYLRIQLEHNTEQLKRVEKAQEEAIFSLIKKREELKHLKGQEKELFAQFFTEYLRGDCLSINDFLYIDRLNLSKGLKEEFK